jgi:hypothetical protein
MSFATCGDGICLEVLVSRIQARAWAIYNGPSLNHHGIGRDGESLALSHRIAKPTARSGYVAIHRDLARGLAMGLATGSQTSMRVLARRSEARWPECSE